MNGLATHDVEHGYHGAVEKGHSGAKSLKILVYEWVTGGGLVGSPLPRSWAIEGTAMRRSIAADFASLPGEAVDVSVTLDARLSAEAGPWTNIAIANHEDAARISTLAGTADFTILIAPETGGVLERLTREFNERGARLLGSSAKAVELTADKAGLASWMDSIGIATPKTHLVEPHIRIPFDQEFPAVLKPADGAGSMDTFFTTSPDELPESCVLSGRYLIQPFVASIPMSASFLVDQHGRAWLIGVGRQHSVIMDRRFHYRGGTIPVLGPECVAEARRLVESIAGLRGFVGVDFLWDQTKGRPTILEINPRPTTSHVGLSRLLPAGMLARAWLEAFQPDDAANEPTLPRLAGLVHQQPTLTFDPAGQLISIDGGPFHE